MIQIHIGLFIFNQNNTFLLNIRTPIHLVCRYGQLQFVNLLLKNGNCDVNAVDGKGKTPLKYVEEKMNKGRNYKIIYDILKENGAKLTWKNEQIDN